MFACWLSKATLGFPFYERFIYRSRRECLPCLPELENKPCLEWNPDETWFHYFSTRHQTHRQCLSDSDTQCPRHTICITNTICTKEQTQFIQNKEIWVQLKRVDFNTENSILSHDELGEKEINLESINMENQTMIWKVSVEPVHWGIPCVDWGLIFQSDLMGWRRLME